MGGAMSMSKHDVFISFRGKDTRLNFTSHLDAALSRKGIKTNVNDDSLERGEDISTAVQRAIEDAKISLVVFSENYASSPRCLDELVHIIKCMKERGQTVIPIFHGVILSDVRKHRGSYGYAFNAHEKRFVDKMDKVSEWRAALSEAADLAGWNSQDWLESKVIENIAEDVAKKLLHSQYQKIKSEDSSSQKFDSDIQLIEKIESTGNQLEEIDSANSQHEENDSVNNQPEEIDSANSQPEENDSTKSQLEENASANGQPEENDSANNQPKETKYRGRFLKEILGVLVGFAGLIFLSQSSFKRLFHDSKTSELLFFGIFSALLIFLVSMAPNWGDVWHKRWSLSFSKKLAIEFLFMGIVWMLTFLIKYPQFDIRSKDNTSCVLRNNERKSQHEPNVWYIPCSVVYCSGLILFKNCIESSPRNPVLPIVSTRNKRRSPRDAVKNIFAFLSALAGILCLFLSPFSKQQFEDSTDFKGACFITFSILLGFSLWKAGEFIDFLVKECHKHYLVKAIVRTLLFAFLSMIMFLTKYPRFKLHSELKESCKEQNGQELKSERNQFDVFSTASFSLFALIMSSGQERPVKLDIFNFLLGLTMDSSIEILGNDEPNFFCLVFSSVYCASLILVKSYLDPGSYQDLQEVPNARDRSFGDDQPLIKSNTVEENKHAIIDIDMGLVNVDDTAVATDTSSIVREDVNTDDNTAVVGDTSSIIEEDKQK